MQKKDAWRLTRKKRETLIVIYFRAKIRKINSSERRYQDIDGNRKLFWKEVIKVNGEKVESCSRIMAGDWRLAMGELKYDGLES